MLEEEVRATSSGLPVYGAMFIHRLAGTKREVAHVWDSYHEIRPGQAEVQSLRRDEDNPVQLLRIGRRRTRVPRLSPQLAGETQVGVGKVQKPPGDGGVPSVQGNEALRGASPDEFAAYFIIRDRRHADPVSGDELVRGPCCGGAVQGRPLIRFGD
jgi:hypothetical protein